MGYWRLCLFRAQRAIFRFGGHSGLFRNDFVKFVHPYMSYRHGSVLFAGIAGKKKEAAEVGTLEREV